MISSGNAAGGPAKTVKIIKVKVEKGTDLQELAKELTRKIKEEREKQTQTKQKTLPSAASSLQVCLSFSQIVLFQSCLDIFCERF